MTRAFALKWAIVFAALAVAFGSTVFVLNSTLYSASGFAASYLDALSRHDVVAALATPGVVPTTSAPTTLLTPDAMAEIESYELVSDEADGGEHKLVFDVKFADEISAKVTFMVADAGQRMGVFNSWKFERSPLGVLEATPRHAADFKINGVKVTSVDGPNHPLSLQVLTPGIFTLNHDSKYLTAEPTTYLADDAVGPTAAELDIQANDDFLKEVNQELARYLDECAKQQILMPTGCPFGHTISNRVEGLPAWSMATYPHVEITPGSDPGSWVVPPTIAAAHLKMQVRSLFDGSLSTFDEDIPFTVEYGITFPGDGSLAITPR